jgi:hypothetical protein
MTAQQVQPLVSLLKMLSMQWMLQQRYDPRL